MLILALLLAAEPCNIHPAYTLEAATSAVRVQREGGGYVATSSLRFELRDLRPAVLPSVGDPGVLDHVRGHIIVAQRVAKSGGGIVRANGATAALARKRLHESIARMQADAQRELDREEQVYDNVTADGTQQDQGPAYGFPGGADVRTTCR
jgi:hypothetical protein